MKLWKLLIILFCAAVSFGFWSNYPGLSPGETLPGGLIIPNPIISSPTLTGLIVTAPGSTLWVMGNVIYEPYSVIEGPDGSVWDHTGLDNLANLNIAAGGSITFNGVPMGGACPANQFMVSLSPTVVPTCAPITNIPGPVTINNPTFTGTVTMPDGGTWTNTGITMPATSHITVGFVNITGTMPGLTFNGVPMGGACGTGDFVNSINANGVPSCGTPSGGGGSLPTPVSIGNGGLGQGVAPIAGQILVASGPTAYNPVTMTGAVTISATGVTAISSAAITDGMLANAYSGVGACNTGLFVHTLNRNAAPTCAPPVTVAATAPATPSDGMLWFSTTDLQTYLRYNDGTSTQWVALINLTSLGGPFAPLVNPVGGQNNYAPIDSPTFTGTVRMPDASLVNNQGYQNIKALGVGGTYGSPVWISTNQPGPQTVQFNNNNTGTSASAAYTATNGPPNGGDAIQMKILSSTFAGGTDPLALSPDSGLLQYGGAGTLNIWANPGSINFLTGHPATVIANVTSAGLGSVLALGIGTAAPNAATGNLLAIEKDWNGTTSGNIANKTAGANAQASLSFSNDVSGGGVSLTSSTFTAGGVSIPHDALVVSTTGSKGLFLSATTAPITLNIGGAQAGSNNIATFTATSQTLSATGNLFAELDIANSTSGTGAGSIIRLSTDTLNAGSAWVFLTSTAYTGSGPNLLGDTLQIAANGTNGINIATNAAISPGPPIVFWSGPVQAGIFMNYPNRIQGLALPGYAGLTANGNAVAGLAIGNSYFTGTSFATLNLTTAAYWNSALNQWVTDGGAGSGVGFLQVSGYTLAYYSGAPAGAGTNVTWTRQFAVNPSGTFTTHQFNDGSMPAPSVTNGTLMSGSRDTFGYILSTAWPVTLTFGRPFPGGINSGCVAIGGAGQSGQLFTSGQTNTSIQISCVNYAGGPACAPLWFQYICFGVG